MPAKLTSIVLRISTKKKLALLKDSSQESFDEVINKLLNRKTLSRQEERVERLSSALLSEKALAKTWLSKEEDEAWKHL